MVNDVTCVVLAGGESRRMGENKAFVMLGDKPLITHTLARLSQLDTAETLIITRNPSQYTHLEARIIQDEGTGRGPLNGICSAIKHCNTEYIFVVACDMPFINAGWVRWLYAQRSNYDAVVPHFDGYPQSLHALYQRRCSEPFAAQISLNNYRMEHALEKINMHFIYDAPPRANDHHSETFFNVNTPEDLSHARKILESSPLK
ncbi:MAG: molybdenum cofactor guanylyltransferase [Aggregatilineales bacterium]